MDKKLIKLKEQDFHRIVKESVEKILEESEMEEGSFFETWRHSL